ncbi:MAG: Hypothetical protein C75L2_00440007 [Leptospirillum sp. Group II 'C75']|uniref:Uncharacterized protein n=1 Tax=Leptospirillum sp. Group II '5-way CG' TaxID=419541 RepID=B6ARZ8_9BACT|nr:MAG: hypothetical protein UBAL2_80490331a [Leptospirillum rubarum]EDZ38253.1 MAG: Hypothetical protein CGL2_10799019 [Leptospirillum sp. Group II '5-way CG']EIJ75549.1 MAG: Hypothetical protein C75L2_00440007 [Leptospirillum sp. Group II 'C75']
MGHFSLTGVGHFFIDIYNKGVHGIVKFGFRGLGHPHVSNGGICQKSSEKFCHITVETKCPLTSNMGSYFL